MIVAMPSRAGIDVEPLDAVAEARGERKQQETQQKHEGDVGVAQLVRRHDIVGGVEVEQRHRDGDPGHDSAGPARKPVGSAFFLLHVLLGLAQTFGGYRLHFLVHRFPHGQPGIGGTNCYRPDFSSLAWVVRVRG